MSTNPSSDKDPSGENTQTQYMKFMKGIQEIATGKTIIDIDGPGTQNVPPDIDELLIDIKKGLERWEKTSPAFVRGNPHEKKTKVVSVEKIPDEGTSPESATGEVLRLVAWMGAAISQFEETPEAVQLVKDGIVDLNNLTSNYPSLRARVCVELLTICLRDFFRTLNEHQQIVIIRAMNELGYDMITAVSRKPTTGEITSKSVTLKCKKGTILFHGDTQ